MDDVYHYLLDEQENSFPLEIEFAVLFICLGGEAEVMLDMKSYRIGRGDLCVIFPHSVVQGNYKSPDFAGYVLGGNLEYISTIQIPSTMTYFLCIKENPCISLTEEELERMLKLCELVKYLQAAPEAHIFGKEVIDKLLMGLCYEIAGLYTQREPIVEQVYGRQDMIFRQFLVSLTKNGKMHREVEFYAEEQCLTARYFSSVVKVKSGESAATWIHRAVVMEAKKLLADRRLSVQQVADELNFPSPSFFGQFFKKYTGMTPKTYRDSL